MEYGLIGEKLGHSFSKPIHEALGYYIYELMPLTKEEFPLFMEKKAFKAINVTIPFKCDVIRFLDELDENARNIGAVNTIVNKNNKLYGYNTDFYGFIYTLNKNMITLDSKKVLVLGNGGSAQAVFAAVRHLNAKEMYVVKYKEEIGTITYEEAAKIHSDADVIINTSPIGMYPNVNESPIDLAPYYKLSAVIDLIYNPLTTKYMAQAEKMHVKAINGLEMLVAQAKYAAEYFLDKQMDDKLIDQIYKDLLESIGSI